MQRIFLTIITCIQGIIKNGPMHCRVVLICNFRPVKETILYIMLPKHILRTYCFHSVFRLCLQLKTLFLLFGFCFPISFQFFFLLNSPKRMDQIFVLSEGLVQDFSHITASFTSEQPCSKENPTSDISDILSS